MLFPKSIENKRKNIIIRSRCPNEGQYRPHDILAGALIFGFILPIILIAVWVENVCRTKRLLRLNKKEIERIESAHDKTEAFE